MEEEKIALRPALESLPRLFALCGAAGADDRLMLAVEEAFVNVAVHSGATRLTVTLRRDGPALSVTLEDDGRPFDPTAHRPDPVAGLVAGGKGILLMQSLADSLRYERRGPLNSLTLTKSK